MSSLSIRKLPPDLEKALRKEAKRQRKTKTGIVIQALESAFHLAPSQERRRKVRDFFGKMSPDEYQAFKKATEEFSRIEEDLWK